VRANVAALLFLIALMSCPISAVAQSQTRLPVVGMLITHPPADDLVVTFFREGLKRFGYEDGKNIKLEVRSALGQLDRVPSLAQELVRLPVDILVVVNEVALRAAKEATQTIPIVIVGFVDDPVNLGWIKSYGHPGGNITGIFNVNSALTAKRLEILKETVPNISRVAVLSDTFGRRQLNELRAAGDSLGVRIEVVEFRGANELSAAFKAAKAAKVGAVFMTWSPAFWVNRAQVAGLALEARLPAISDMEAVTEAGCLLSYGADAHYNWERAAYFVDRLLKKADPADLPVEQISKLTLAVNLKTAKALGITIPESILLRADEVIR
jgi:putative ABC transport system substrate-binding protein